MKFLIFFALFLLLLMGCSSHGGEGHQEGGHGEAAEHENHDEHGPEKIIDLHPEEMKEFGIKLAQAKPHEVIVSLEFAGEISADPDRVAHVAPRVSGVVRGIQKRLGDSVRKGEILAVLESRELAEAKAAYLAGVSRLGLAQSVFAREKDLWEKRISAEHEFLEAKTALSEAQIQLSSAEQILYALGLDVASFKRFRHEPKSKLASYPILAPFDGLVVQKHISLGETVDEISDLFVVADLTSVWVNLSVNLGDASLVQAGQMVRVKNQHGSLEAHGPIDYVSPLVDEETRTVNARVTLGNNDGLWKPGMFVTCQVVTESFQAALAVPLESVQRMEGEDVLFVQVEDGFTSAHVKTGRRDKQWVEILSGLEPGQTYVSKNAFTVKAELGKSSFGDGHGH